VLVPFRGSRRHVNTAVLAASAPSHATLTRDASVASVCQRGKRNHAHLMQGGGLVARIINVHPGRGQVDDRITIDFEYDPPGNGAVPNVVHVVFASNVDAPEFNVTAVDRALHRQTVVARVPNDAVTGQLEVDVAGAPPIRTQQNFTVTRQNPEPLRVQQIMPTMGQGYQRGTRMTIRLSGAMGPARIAGVYFPRSDYGPANLQALGVSYSQAPPTCTINAIPQQTGDHGRVKISLGPTAVYTRVLTFR
jgi:hypothetical protein